MPSGDVSAEMKRLFDLVSKEGASDLLISAGAPPALRVNGQIRRTKGDALTVTITYHTPLTGTRTFTDQYRIEGTNTTTITALKDRDFGMGLLDKLLVATLMIGLLAGIFGMVLGGLAALLVAILFFGFFTYIGFIPLWGAAISVILGFLLLARKGGD